MFGAHLSKTNYLEELTQTNADIFQIFISNPRGYQSPTVIDKNIFSLAPKPVVLHLPYLVNFASERLDVRENSLKLYENTVSGLNSNFHSIVVHGGQGGKLVDVNIATQRWLDTLTEVKPAPTKLLIENTAGGNAAPGKNLNDLINLVLLLRETGQNVGVCYDTCHAWAAGVESLIAGYELLVDKLGAVDLIHFNDSRDPLASNRDRHALLKEGLIPFTTLEQLLLVANKDNVPFILETPGDKILWAKEIELLRSLTS